MVESARASTAISLRPTKPRLRFCGETKAPSPMLCRYDDYLRRILGTPMARPFAIGFIAKMIPK